MLKNVTVDNLYPHPDNPRQQVGDVVELANSILENGILQNLTVVPWFSEITRAPADDDSMNDCYRVVIGHRRLAAAKLAGLKEVPCQIVEMSPAEQMETMLMENMQRSDLTPYEQAQGFQMMMDLGVTKSAIAERTGFSRTTIDHRLHLLDLDQEVLKELGDQITMKDLIKLERIEDAEIKQELLQEHGGTDDFDKEVGSAIFQQNMNKNMEALHQMILDSTAFSIRTAEQGWEKNQSYVGQVSCSGTDESVPDVDTWLKEKGVAEEADIKAVKTFSGYTFYVIEADTATKETEEQDIDPETQKKEQWLERCTAAEKELRDLLKKQKKKGMLLLKSFLQPKHPLI